MECPKCKSKDIKFVRLVGEEDVYECQNCGKEIRVYIPE